METPIDPQLLVVFCTVAEQTSFSKAASKLGVGKGTVSRSIARLESLLEVELIHRTTHRVSLSTAGLALYERARAPLRALQLAVQELPELDDDPSGVLRMTVPPEFGTVLLPGVLGAFSRRYPSIRFDIRMTAERIDLVKEGYDLAIRGSVGQLEDSALTMRRLGRSAATFCAAPSYLARRGPARRLGDPRHVWILHPSAHRQLNASVDEVHFLVDDFQAARGLAAEGAGIACLPDFIARDHIRQGLLEEVSLPDAPPMDGELVLLYPTSGQLPRKVVCFRDYLVEVFRPALA